jgi:hypothetical protein
MGQDCISGMICYTGKGRTIPRSEAKQTVADEDDDAAARQDVLHPFPLHLRSAHIRATRYEGSASVSETPNQRPDVPSLPQSPAIPTDPPAVPRGHSAAQLAARWGCSTEHVRGLRISGRLAGIQIGPRRYIFTDEAVADFMRRGGEACAPAQAEGVRDEA